MKKTILFWTAVLVLIISGTGYTQDTFIVGVTPFTDPGKLKTAFMPFGEYLSESIGMPVEILVPKTYDDLGKAIVKGKVSLGFCSPALYVMTKDKNPDEIHYLLTCRQVKGQKSRSHYYGYFLVNANSPYKSLKDLKGKKWAFTKKSSTSGYQYPTAYFKRKSIEPEKYFSEIKFLEKHPRITDALASWKPGADNLIDGGATWDVNLWDAQEKHGKIFRKIVRVGPIPQLAVAVSKTVSQNKNLKNKIIKIMTENVPGYVTGAENFPFSGWEKGSDHDFDITRRVVQANE